MKILRTRKVYTILSLGCCGLDMYWLGRSESDFYEYKSYAEFVKIYPNQIKLGAPL